PRPFVPLGTDGYGYSDTRAALRRHFEVDAPNIVVATLHALAQTEAIKDEVVVEAIARFDIDADKADPRVAGPATDAAPEGRRRSSSWSGSSSRGSSSSHSSPDSSSYSSSSSDSSSSRSRSASVPSPSRKRPSSNPCFNSRASRNRRARPFLGTSPPALLSLR